MSVSPDAFIAACQQARFLSRDITCTSLQALIFLYTREITGHECKLRDVQEHLECSSSSATRIVQSHLDDAKGTGLLSMKINPDNRSMRLISFTARGRIFMKSILNLDEVSNANNSTRESLSSND